MDIPKEYVGEEEELLIQDNNYLQAAIIDGYMNWRNSINRPRLKSVFAMTSLFQMTKNSSAIVACINSGHVDSAKSLLRVNTEIYINLLYIYTEPHNKAYVRLGYTSEMLYLSNIDKYERFTNETYTRNKLSAEDFDNFRKPFRKAKKQWVSLNHGNDIKNVPDLRARVEIIRKKLGVVWPSELYFNTYLFLSEYIHATPSSIFEVISRGDFDEMWLGNKEHKSIRDTIKIQNEILASTIFFLNKVGLGLDTIFLDKGLIPKYNRHIVHRQLITSL